jgi:hypothetical protein
MIDAIINGLLILFGLAFVGIVTYVIYDETKYKHTAIIKENNKGTELRKILKAKEYIDADGNIKWKIRKIKDSIPRPPNQAITLNEKGRFTVEFYALDGGEIKPVIDNGYFKENQDEFIRMSKPVTPSQRHIIISEIQKANRDKKKTIAEVITYAIPFIALVMIITMFMIFFGEAVQPMIDLGDKNEVMLDQMNEMLINTNQILDRADSIINDRQYINNIEQTGGSATPTPAPN